MGVCGISPRYTVNLVWQVKSKRKLVDVSQHIQMAIIIQCQEGTKVIPGDAAQDRDPAHP